MPEFVGIIVISVVNNTALAKLEFGCISTSVHFKRMSESKIDKSADTQIKYMATRVLLAFYFFAAASFLVVSLSLNTAATQTSLPPIADSCVASDQPYANNGQSAVLWVLRYEQESADATDIEDTWLKFNLSTIPPEARINSITLRMHTNKFTSGFTNKVGVFTCEDDSWTESEITWNNSPMASSTQPLSTLDVAAVDRHYDFNVTSIAEDRLVVTLILKALKSTNLFGKVAFDSKEGSTPNPPLLIVDYESSSPTPDLMLPAIIAVVATGGVLTALIGRRYLGKFRKGKK